MKDKDIFHGFIEVTKGKGTESYFAAEEIIGQSVIKSEKPDAETIIKTAHAIFRKLANCIESGQKPPPMKFNSSLRNTMRCVSRSTQQPRRYTKRMPSSTESILPSANSSIRSIRNLPNSWPKLWSHLQTVN